MWKYNEEKRRERLLSEKHQKDSNSKIQQQGLFLKEGIGLHIQENTEGTGLRIFLEILF